MTIEELYSLYTKHGKVTTDTRNINANDIFFALKGGNFNGNAFAKKAIELGAFASIVDEKEYEDLSNNIFYFEDCLDTLQKLAKHHREQLTIPVIGLTGSNGKTTTKELIAATLAEKYKVLYTEGNLNNHIGVPLTLLSIKPEHEIAIIEMGANHQKEIELLSSLCLPNYGYITNFGKAHLEGFGGYEGVIKGKSELYQNLKQHKQTAIVNTDDPKQVELTQDLQTISFGSQSNYHFELVHTGDIVGVKYENETITSQLTGEYNFTNICVTIRIGLHFDIDLQSIKKGIENYTPKNHRSQIVDKNGVKLVLDTYNANPSSMELSLNNFNSFEGTKTIIIGDMFELGTLAEEEHQKITDLAESLSFDAIFLLGENFANTKTNRAIKVNSTTDMIELLKVNKIDSENILLKGSRGMALEKLIDFL